MSYFLGWPIFFLVPGRDVDRFSIGHVFPIQFFERKGKWLQISTSYWLILHWLVVVLKFSPIRAQVMGIHVLSKSVHEIIPIILTQTGHFSILSYWSGLEVGHGFHHSCSHAIHSFFSIVHAKEGFNRVQSKKKKNLEFSRFAEWTKSGGKNVHCSNMIFRQF